MCATYPLALQLCVNTVQHPRLRCKEKKDEMLFTPISQPLCMRLQCCLNQGVNPDSKMHSHPAPHTARC